jgi:hypothetical protein
MVTEEPDTNPRPLRTAMAAFLRRIDELRLTPADAAALLDKPKPKAKQ